MLCAGGHVCCVLVAMPLPPPLPPFVPATMCPQLEVLFPSRDPGLWVATFLCMFSGVFKTSTAMLSPRPCRELCMEADQIKTVPSTPGAGAEITPCNYNVVNL